MTLELIIAAGVLAFLSAFMLWKIAENNRHREANGQKGGFSSHNALQILFFFMIIASLIILGRAGLDSGTQCEFLLTNQTEHGNTTYFSHDYICENAANNNNIWIYKLPLFLAKLSALYLFVFFIVLIYNLYKDNKKKRSERE